MTVKGRLLNAFCFTSERSHDTEAVVSAAETKGNPFEKRDVSRVWQRLTSRNSLNDRAQNTARGNFHHRYLYSCAAQRRAFAQRLARLLRRGAIATRKSPPRRSVIRAIRRKLKL